MNGVIGKAGVAMAPGNLTRQHGADGAVDVAHRCLNGHWYFIFDGVLGLSDQGVVQRLVEAVILFFTIVDGHTFAGFRLGEDAREIETLGFPMI